MRILHLNAGNETGGGMYHILSLLKKLNRDDIILGVFEEGELLKRANEAGIQTVYFSNNTRLSLPLLNKIAAYIKEKNISIVHTHGPRANVYMTIIKRMASFKWIVTVHSNPMLDFLGKGLYGSFLSKLHVSAVKNADKVIAISDPFRRNLIDAGVNDSKIVTALNGIDFQEKCEGRLSRQDFGIGEAEMLFLKVARLDPVKGHDIALEAFSKIIKRRRNCHLMLVGDGEIKERLKSLTKSLNIVDNVHFLGYRNDVDLLYKLADVTMLTSLSESFPLVLLESAKAKTPVISTDVGGVRELIADLSLGWCIKPKNVSELVNSMEQAIFFKKKGMLTHMGEKLHKHASTKFSLEIFADNIYNVYQSVAKSM